MRILVIDDDRQIRALFRNCLARDGYDVVEAEDGVTGLALFEDTPADLVVVDLFMPGRNGWETIQRLQDCSPGVPFLVISGSAPLEGLKRGSPATLASMDGLAPFRVLRKPLSLEVLRSAVTELCSSRVDVGER
jgi:CheY-like chemotaxis protein